MNTDKLRELLAKADIVDEWEWHAGGAHGQYGRSNTIAIPNGSFHELNVLKTDDDWGGRPEDLDLIVAAVNALPHLLDRLDAVLALHVRLPQARYCRHCQSHWPCPTARAAGVTA